MITTFALQGSAKAMSNSLGLEYFPVWRADSIGHLPDGQPWSTIFMANLGIDILGYFKIASGK